MTFGQNTSLSRRPLPAELQSEAALLAHLGLTAGELKKIWWFRGRMYDQFTISRKSRKARIILAPDKRLKHLQRKICKSLEQVYRVRNPVHGFVFNKSVKTNAESHLGRKYVVNLDIKEFFGSILENRIIGMLASIGIDRRVSEIVVRISCVGGHLPQGAPTSPILSNMFCFGFDKELMKIARDAKCIYTRYADDITFSSFQPITKLFSVVPAKSGPFSPVSMSPPILQTFSSYGFTIHPEKAHYADQHSRRMVTGLKINESVNLDRRFVRNIRATIFSVQTLGIEKAQEKFVEKYNGSTSIERHLAGKIAWVRFVKGQTDPIFRTLAKSFNSIFGKNYFKISPSFSEMRDRSVWIIENLEDDVETYIQGSAFFLEEVGLVTAAHCVEGAKNLVVHHPGKPANKFKVTVKSVDNHRDIAILSESISTNEYFQFKISNSQVKFGDLVTAIGYPGFGPGDRINIREGTVTSIAIKHGVPLIEVSQKLPQGMSGGPIINDKNEVVGIIHKGGPEMPRDFAINISALKDWLHELAPAPSPDAAHSSGHILGHADT